MKTFVKDGKLYSRKIEPKVPMPGNISYKQLIKELKKSGI